MKRISISSPISLKIALFCLHLYIVNWPAKRIENLELLPQQPRTDCWDIFRWPLRRSLLADAFEAVINLISGSIKFWRSWRESAIVRVELPEKEAKRARALFKININGIVTMKTVSKIYSSLIYHHARHRVGKKRARELDKANRARERYTWPGAPDGGKKKEKNLHSKVLILEIKLHLSSDLEIVYYLFIFELVWQP